MRLSVPGNLLLAGEYLILDEGGQGLAVAVEPRLSATASASPGIGWSIKAIMGETSLFWGPEGCDVLPLAECMMQSCTVALDVRGKSMPAPLAIEVDSSSFFGLGGRKAGFGSSAAAAVAIAMLTGRAAGLKDADLIDFSAEAALAGHRASQGGRGSGYEVMASLHGGCGVFTGGTKPGWKVLGSLPPMQVVLVSGPAAVHSSEAVRAYRLWLARQTARQRPSPESGSLSDTDCPAVPAMTAKAGTILAAMQAAVSALVKATVTGKVAAFSLAMDQAGAAGRQLGEAIGYSASIASPPGFEADNVKALGAGNELGLLVVGDMRMERPDPLPPGCFAFRPTGGPQWLS